MVPLAFRELADAIRERQRGREVRKCVLPFEMMLLDHRPATVELLQERTDFVTGQCRNTAATRDVSALATAERERSADSEARISVSDARMESSP